MSGDQLNQFLSHMRQSFVRFRSPSWREKTKPLCGLPCDVVIILDVVLKRADFDVGETGRFQELDRLLLAPHCAQTHAALASEVVMQCMHEIV